MTVFFHRLTIRSTHDDITYASIARAYHLSLELHEETIDKMAVIQTKRLETDHLAQGLPLDTFRSTFVMTPARQRMATLPSGENVQVIFPSSHLWVPLVIVNKNVHVLPGLQLLLAIYPRDS